MSSSSKSNESRFADMLAAGKPARVFMADETYRGHALVVARLRDLGGKVGSVEPHYGGKVYTHVAFACGVEVTLFHGSHEAYGIRCDVAVGFEPASSTGLLAGSPVGLAVSEADAPSFWGLS